MNSNEPSEPAPPWLVTAISVAEAVGLKPGRPVRLTLTIISHLGLIVWVLYCIFRGLRAAAHDRLPVDTVGCAVRAELPYILFFVSMVIDFLGMVRIVRLEGGSHFWSASGGKALGCARVTSIARQSMGSQPAYLIMTVVVNSLWLVLWLAPGGGWEWELAGIVGIVGANFFHLLVNGIQAEFMVCSVKDAQKKFEDELMAGRYDYNQAVRAYKEVNEKRRRFTSELGTSFNIALFLWLAAEINLVYDWFLKPWSSWPLLAMYVWVGLCIMGMVAPYVEMNDWPEQLSERVAEDIDGEFLWSPTERTNFITFLSSTRTSLEFAGFSFNKGFYLALFGYLVGWFMYIAELKQFHEFEGLPFDQACDGPHHEEGEF